MMRYKSSLALSLTILLSTGTFNASAQTNSLEAKAAYLLAEESYGKGDMSAAIQYLDEASSKLGKPNAKILYLKIMALKELSAKDKTVSEQLATSITAFEKAPDFASFNEEKVLEVIKLKMELKRQGSLDAEANKALLNYQEKIGWYIGMSTDSMIQLKKAFFDNYFRILSYKNGKLEPNEMVTVMKQDGSISEAVHRKDGKVFMHIYYLYMNLKETEDFGYGKQKLPGLLEQLKNTFGYLPEPVDKPNPGAPNVVTTTYTWASKETKAVLYLNYTTSATGKSSMFHLMLSRPEAQ